MFYFFFFQAEDGIRDLVRSRGLGDVYKRQYQSSAPLVDLLPRDCRTSGAVIFGPEHAATKQLSMCASQVLDNDLPTHLLIALGITVARIHQAHLHRVTHTTEVG